MSSLPLPVLPLASEERSAFLGLPLDILCEICGWLSPDGILALARTAKPLRGYLMSRASRATIWDPALRSLEYLEVPKCNKNVSEPRLLHLLFDSFCDDCGQESTLPMEHDTKMHRCYEIYKILCQGCILKNYATYRNVVRKPSDLPWAYGQLQSMVPTLEPSCAGVTSDSDYSMLEWDSESEEQGLETPVPRRSKLFHIESVMRYQQRWVAGGRPEQVEGVFGFDMRDKREREEWKKFGAKCAKFHANKRSYDRRQTLANRLNRQAFTIRRLSGLGFEKEAETFFTSVEEGRKYTIHYQEYVDKYVKTGRDDLEAITEEGWASMEAEFVGWMRAEREWWEVRHPRSKSLLMPRVYGHFATAFTSFALSEPPNSILPSPVEVLLMPEWVEALAEKPYTRCLDSTKVAAAVSAMPAFVDGIKRMRIRQLLDVVRNSKTYAGRVGEVTEDTLTLASTVFRCKRCSECIHYPHVLVHFCNYAAPEWKVRQWGRRSVAIPEEVRVVEQVGVPEEWTSRPTKRLEEKILINAFGWDGGIWNDLLNIEFGDAAHEHVLVMLDTLGKNRRTTAEEMEREQPYVKCLCQCFTRRRKANEGKPVMRWMKALHSCRKHEETEKRKKWYAKIDKVHVSLISEAERARALLTTQACFWILNDDPNKRAPSLIDLGNPDVETLEGDRRRFPWGHKGLHGRIRHNIGDEAMREYVEGRTLVSSEQLRREKPLAIKPRRSDRQKKDGSEGAGASGSG